MRNIQCETRHQFARSVEELGDRRPFTGWSDSQPTTCPGWVWNEWAEPQVHRIHDLMDINTLRMAQGYTDPTYKTMVWVSLLHELHHLQRKARTRSQSLPCYSLF